MAYTSSDLYAGAQQISTVSTVKQVPLGTEVKVVDATYGEGTAVYLAVPVSTAIAAGIIVYANASQNAVALPANSTSKKTGRNVYVALNAVTSDASNVQYTWFLKKGVTAVLKTAIQVTLDQPLYISATAGRFYLTASAGAQILGARTVNATTITTTTSTVLVQIDNPVVQGFA